jgi:hypothetical protein
LAAAAAFLVFLLAAARCFAVIRATEAFISHVTGHDHASMSFFLDKPLGLFGVSMFVEV